MVPFQPFTEAMTDDHLVIRDSMGNRYEIQSVKALNAETRQRLELVL